MEKISSPGSTEMSTCRVYCSLLIEGNLLGTKVASYFHRERCLAILTFFLGVGMIFGTALGEQ